jgi:CubicO group peptidase (beta-lactamase class C family)
MSKTKRFALAAAALGAIVVAAMFSWRFLHSPPTTFDIGQALQQIVSETVTKDPSVKNCVLSVMKGNGSLEWSGAAGRARQSPPVPMTQDTPIYIASITKLYTATAVMLLYEKGALSLDDSMAKFLPPSLIQGIHVYSGKDYSGAITIRQLLSHRSGIADYYTEKSADGRTLFELFVAEPDRSWTVDDTIARARTGLKAHFAPDTKTSYSDTNFQLLGKVIEAVTGKPLHVALDEFLFRPLKLEHTSLGIGFSLPAPAAMAEVFKEDLNITKTRANGAYWADGGIVSTAMAGLPPLWGHSGSTGSFLYRSEDLDLYLAGTIDQTQSKVTPFLLMRRAMRAIQSRQRVQVGPSRSAGAAVSQ